MKKNNIKTIITAVGIIALIGALFYFGGRNKSSTTSPAAIDPMHNSAAANLSISSLNNLADKPAPDFSFADRDGKVYSSDNLRGKNVILFFNEGLMCYPACWNQIVALSKDDRFKNDDTLVLSVVVDSKEDWQQAINKMPELAQATVVFDKDAGVSKNFGILSTPSSMHPGSFPGHTFVIIDKEGVIRYVFDDPNMGIRNDQLWSEVTKLIPDDSNTQ